MTAGLYLVGLYLAIVATVVLGVVRRTLSPSRRSERSVGGGGWGLLRTRPGRALHVMRIEEGLPMRTVVARRADPAEVDPGCC